ncbi:MAG: ABC transporter substrate-binding protein [Defluviitaleaceae bacterium]|nr:ABC transporter substrate-binding protein [Defluviitaleaceae bacterium]MCL2264296.1 ABC transporter substrate-binding protein [Defluviitaleaceae bacterium]
MKKRLSRVGISMLLAFTFLFLLAACADNQPAAPAVGEDGEVNEVVIGVLAPLTGPVARFGVAVRDGVMLYIDGFNAQGGLQIRPIIFDEEGDMGQAVIGYHSLVDQGITALIGSVTSGPTMAVVPEANADGMPMITATSTHLNVTVDAATGRVWENVFRSCFIDPFQGTKMAEFAREVIGAETAAVLFSNDIDYSIGLMEAFVERAGQIGLEIVATEVFAQDAIDYVGQLTNIAALNPDVLFVPGYVEHVALIGPQSAQVGLDAIIIGADGWDGVLDIMAEGQRSTLEGSFHLTGFTVEDETPMVQDFITRFTEATGSPPDMFSAQAYDAAMILIAAIQRTLADGYLPNTPEFKAATIAHMAATDMTAVTGHITFDQYNNPQKTAVIIEFVDGEPRLWGTF